jgi:hypothetical protein
MDEKLAAMQHHLHAAREHSRGAADRIAAASAELVALQPEG